MKSKCCLFGCFLVVTASLVLAGGAKVAAVDVERIFIESKFAKNARIQLSRSQRSQVRKGRHLQDELDRLRFSLDAEQAKLSPEQRAGILDQITVKQQEFNNFQKAAAASFEAIKARRLKEFSLQISIVAGRVARERGFEFVVDRSGDALVFVDEKIDITDAVITQLDSPQPSDTRD